MVQSVVAAKIIERLFSHVTMEGKSTAAPKGSRAFAVWGFEPEGSWQGASGALQPEAACAAAQVESHRFRHDPWPVWRKTHFPTL